MARRGDGRRWADARENWIDYIRPDKPHDWPLALRFWTARAQLGAVYGVSRHDIDHGIKSIVAMAQLLRNPPRVSIANHARALDIVRRRRAGETFRDIAIIYGVSSQRIRHIWLDQPGLSAAMMGNKGRKLTAQHRAKLSAAMMGKTLSVAHRAKMSAAQIGRVFTPEHRAKLSAAKRKRQRADVADAGALLGG